MRKMIAFNQMSLDGFIADHKSDMSWAHKSDQEWGSFMAENASGPGVLVFGRVTYEMMAAFWPTPAAVQSAPDVANGMNQMQKIVFSRTLDVASWSNTTVVKGNLETEVGKLKRQEGDPLVILGSASIVSQLSRSRLIDEYQIAVNSIILGGGKSMFPNGGEMTNLKLIRSRIFINGNALLCYEPVR